MSRRRRKAPGPAHTRRSGPGTRRAATPPHSQRGLLAPGSRLLSPAAHVLANSKGARGFGGEDGSPRDAELAQPIENDDGGARRFEGGLETIEADQGVAGSEENGPTQSRPFVGAGRAVTADAGGPAPHPPAHAGQVTHPAPHASTPTP